MKSFRQLMRQPIKTLSGVILVAMAVAILCVCVGQSAAAANMLSSMVESYTTVALVTNKYQTGSIPEEALEWIKQAVAENPDIILTESHAGLASAYISELHPDNYTQYVRQETSYNDQNLGLMASKFTPYTGVITEITLTEYAMYIDSGDGLDHTVLPETDDAQPEGKAVVTIRGTIENVIALEQGYADPTGFEAIITVTFPDVESWLEFEPQLVIGERYLTCGWDYTDNDWVLRSGIASGDGILPSFEFGNSFPGFCIDRLDPDELIYINSNQANVAYYIYDYIDINGNPKSRVVNFTQWQLDNQFNKVSYTLTAAEDRPSIVKLSGTAEEFLASDAGTAWREERTAMEISNQSFAVIGVDELMYVGDFATQQAIITEGRNFTTEELAGGAKVCVISKYLAEQNGLSVGDTLTTRFFNALQTSISGDQGVINPTANYFTSDTEFAGEAESYTIVGLYDQTYFWNTSGGDLYAFNPNTIFAPKTSITGGMEYCEIGMFHSLVLKNGSISAFEKLQKDGGQESLFVCYDQGYTELSENLYSYESIADQALKVGLIVYCVVLLLYFVLFPTRQGKVIATMASFGATRRDKLRHINLSGLGILVPGTVIGLTAGVLMRQKVIDALTRSADVVLPLKMDVGSLILVAALQFVLAAGLTFLISLPMCRNKSLLKGKGLRGWFGRLKLNTWTVTAFALIISMVLCGLNASNEAEIANFEQTRREIPITVTVMDLYGDSSENLNLDTWVVNIMSGFYNWGLSDYLTDVRIGFDLNIDMINGEWSDRQLRGILSVNAAPELLPITNSAITWYEGYDESVFEGEELVCIVPAGYTDDADPTTDEQELDMTFNTYSQPFPNLSGAAYNMVSRLTVVGTYESTQSVRAIYCPYHTADTIRARLQVGVRVDSASATLKNNDDLEQFRLVAKRFFAEPDPNSTPDSNYDYSLKIDTEALDKAEAVLNNSITINRISTYLVFVLSAGAGFFLGFLMIRSRKREIILMRTLGKPNAAIYRDFAWEQMLRVLLGVAVGGAVFQWEPLGRLGMFVLVYFVGLSAALILFLNSKLLTNIKEDE